MFLSFVACTDNKTASPGANEHAPSEDCRGRPEHYLKPSLTGVRGYSLQLKKPSPLYIRELRP